MVENFLGPDSYSVVYDDDSFRQIFSAVTNRPNKNNVRGRKVYLVVHVFRGLSP